MNELDVSCLKVILQKHNTVADVMNTVGVNPKISSQTIAYTVRGLCDMGFVRLCDAGILIPTEAGERFIHEIPIARCSRA